MSDGGGQVSAQSVIAMLACIMLVLLILVISIFRYVLEDRETDISRLSANTGFTAAESAETRKLLQAICDKLDAIIANGEMSDISRRRETDALLAMNAAFLGWAESQGLITRVEE